MKIITDCAADLPKKDVDDLGIMVAPLYIQFPGEEISSDDISPDDFYARLKNMWPQIPTTAQPSAEYFASKFKQLAENGEEILSIHISSGLSGTVNSARLGAEGAPQAAVSVFDSQTLSGGQRFQILAAARMQQLGMSREAILKQLEKLRAVTEVVFTLETLAYLAKGGRIGRVQALAGALLNIKPIIHVDHVDGKYSTVGKARTIPKSLDAIVDYLEQKFGKTALWVSVMYGQFEEQAKALAERLQQRLNVGCLEILRISPVLGVHTGPGIVGVAAIPLAMMEELS